MKFLYPSIYVKSIKSIPYKKLLDKNINTLIFDIDNTLVPFDMPHAAEDLVEYLNNIRAMGFKICLLSNNNKKRVNLFNKNLNFPAIYNAKKPLSTGLYRALKLLNSNPNQTAIVGDQIFTDIWCGNRNNMVTILTCPIEKRDTFGVFLKRGVERLIVKSFVKKVRKYK